MRPPALGVLYLLFVFQGIGSHHTSHTQNFVSVPVPQALVLFGFASDVIVVNSGTSGTSFKL